MSLSGVGFFLCSKGKGRCGLLDSPAALCLDVGVDVDVVSAGQGTGAICANKSNSCSEYPPFMDPYNV